MQSFAPYSSNVGLHRTTVMSATFEWELKTFLVPDSYDRLSYGIKFMSKKAQQLVGTYYQLLKLFKLSALAKC